MKTIRLSKRFSSIGVKKGSLLIPKAYPSLVAKKILIVESSKLLFNFYSFMKYGLEKNSKFNTFKDLLYVLNSLAQSHGKNFFKEALFSNFSLNEIEARFSLKSVSLLSIIPSRLPRKLYRDFRNVPTLSKKTEWVAYQNAQALSLLMGILLGARTPLSHLRLIDAETKEELEFKYFYCKILSLPFECWQRLFLSALELPDLSPWNRQRLKLGLEMIEKFNRSFKWILKARETSLLEKSKFSEPQNFILKHEPFCDVKNFLLYLSKP